MMMQADSKEEEEREKERHDERSGPELCYKYRLFNVEEKSLTDLFIYFSFIFGRFLNIILTKRLIDI